MYLIRQLRSYFKLLGNSFKVLTKTGDYWYWLRDDQYPDLEIKDLVYPLRYDILIRKDFFSFYADNRQIYLSDFTAFVEMARNHDYYIWFTRVAMPKASLELRSNPEAIEQAFVRRVKKSATLFDQIEKCGFDEKFPIVPCTAEIILPTITEKILSNKYYMGDGCHRLACLMSMGYMKLPKKFCRVKCYREFVPLDNTSLLSTEQCCEVNWPDNYIV